MYQERRSDQSVEPRPNLYFTVKSQRHTTDLYHYSLLTGPTGLGTGSGLLMGATTWFIVSAGRILGKATANTHRSCCRSHLPFLLNQGRFGGSQSSAWSNPALPAPPQECFHFFSLTQCVDLMGGVADPSAAVEPSRRGYQAA